MKFGTDTDMMDKHMHGMVQKTLISKNLSTVFTFKVKLGHLKEYDDYITLHNLHNYATYIRSDPLPYALHLLGQW